MATLTAVAVTRNGAEVVTNAAACGVSGDAFSNTGQQIAVFTNAGGAPVTVTFVTQNTVDGQPVADRTVTVANASTFAIGPFPKAIYNDANDLVQMTYSAVADLYVKVLTVPQA